MGEKIIFTLKEIGRNGVDRINLALDRDEWHTLVEMSQAISFHKRQDISSLSEELLAFQGSAPCSMLVNWVYMSLLE